MHKNKTESIAEISFTATHAALLAGELLKKGFGSEFRVQSKGSPGDYVTEYDQRAEELILSFIKSRHPKSNFIAEESGKNIQNDNELIWIIDPLDGTTNFVQKVPIFGTSIAATLNGEVIASAIYLPMVNELFTAMKGTGAFLNGSKISVSNQNNLDDAFFVTGFPYNLKGSHHRLKPINEILLSGSRLRDLGSAVVDVAYVAAGRFDAWFIESPSPWDCAAGLLIAKEAGATYSHMDGSPFDLFCPKDILVSNSLLHDQIIQRFLKIK